MQKQKQRLLQKLISFKNGYGIVMPVTNVGATFCKGLDVSECDSSLPVIVLDEFGLEQKMSIGNVRRVTQKEFDNMALVLQNKLIYLDNRFVS